MKHVIGWSIALALPTLVGGSLNAQKVAAPTGVTVTSNAAALTVSWNNMANVVQYAVNRRNPQQPLANVPGSPYSGALPASGVAYEYQVVSIGKGKNNQAGSAWVAYTVPATITATPIPTTPGVIVTEPRPGGPGATITPTIVPSAPAYLNAGSNIPGQIWLSWREVTNATAYRVTRSSNAPEPEVKVTELSSSSQLAEGGIWSFVHAPVDERWTHTYRVYALNAGNVSPSSPPATAKTMAVVQPTGLRYAVTLTPTAGRVNVTLTWGAVPNAVKYLVTGLGFTGTPQAFAAGTSFALNNIMAGGSYRICVGTIYPYDVQDAATAPCVDVTLR